MFEQASNQTITKPTKQLVVDWIEAANNILDSNLCIVNFRKEIGEIIGEIFGDNNMGFQPEEESDGDPFSSSEEEGSNNSPFSENSCSEEEENNSSAEEVSSTTLPGLSAYVNSDSADSSDSSICGPDYEPLSDCISIMTLQCGD